MTAAQPPKRVRGNHVAWVRERLNERDWKILELVNRLHLVTGLQVERVAFATLSPASQIVARSRSLSRLVRWRVLCRLPRRVGGPQRGSSATVYALDSAGQWLLHERANHSTKRAVIRRPGSPGERFVAHILAVSELYARLVEAERTYELRLVDFAAEPSSWWSNGRGGWLKPDAYFAVSNGHSDYLWWAEIDRATESLPTIERKLRAYLDFECQGGLGPRAALPRVLITVPDEQRRVAVSGVVTRLPEPAGELFTVAVASEAVAALVGLLEPP
jgi:hypothetical protein